MKDTKKTYWKGLEQLTNNPEFVKNLDKEFLPISDSDGGDPNRRDFLKVMGFGIAAASLAACEAPVRKAIPYLDKPVEIDPSIPNYYASTYISGSDFCSIVVKTREGRPIKIDGNKLSMASGGGTSAQVEASVLSLYDQERLETPYIAGEKSTWEAVDKAVISGLDAQAGKVVIVSNSVCSPSTKMAIEGLTSKFGGQHIQYDPISYDGILESNSEAFGSRVVPSYDFSKADTIVSFGADFLGGWLNGVLFSKQFAKTRKLSEKKKTMSRLYSFESNLSLTGANADYRTPIKPSQEGLLVANLYNLIAAKSGGSTISVEKIDHPRLKMAADDLMKSKGKSLIVSGSNDKNVQLVINGINYLLGNYGSTLDVSVPYLTKKGSDANMLAFVNDLKGGKVGAVVFYNCNPVYDHAAGAEIAAAISKAKLSVATADRMDETSSICQIVAPDHHYLESWNDFEPIKGHISFSQPTISNIFKTRQAQESFLVWAGNDTNYYDLLQSNWKQNYFSTQSEISDFQSFVDQCLHDGVLVLDTNSEQTEVSIISLDTAAGQIAKNYKSNAEGLELSLYTNAAIGVGTQANNPWLQEMSDPITKACWDNYLTISPSLATELGIATGDMLTQKVILKSGSMSLTVPVLVQPGQAKGTVGLALGYGRKTAGKVANNLGVDAFPMVDYTKDFQSLSGISVTLENTGESYQIAQTQTHHTFMARAIIQESTLAEYQKDSWAGRVRPMITTYDGKKKPSTISLWNGHEYPNHHWGMVVDLNSCTGCGACTIACQSENNIPVVGKQEVLNRREMAWLRIDRYYSSDADVDDLKGLEVAADNPEVTFQPMMCQQCNNAPCETVCPVAATTHSSEGLNQMTYNRCIGTRYCANNCPYKVRRFNWFKYHDNSQFSENLAMNNDLGKMVLNPDVTVRARGVMEKCTFCVQRVQAGKLQAKREGRRPIDGEIVSACASACPSEAIVFGDLKNPDSRVASLLNIQKNEDGKAEVTEARAYHVLEELNVDPNVWYYTKIRNKVKEETEA